MYDLFKDIDYIKKSHEKMNRNSVCSKTESYIKRRNSNFMTMYNNPSYKYSGLLKYYDITSFDEFDSIIQRIECASDEDVASS